MLALLSLAILGLVAGLLAMGVWHTCRTPQSQWLGPALVRGPADGRKIALTFDDGPALPFTEEILAILRARRVPATFFVCGLEAERFPATLRQILADGHTIGNHTYSHPCLVPLSRARMAEEIDRTQEAIHAIAGSRPALFRPPYGVRWFGLYPVLAQRGMQVVAWSDLGYDWLYPAEKIVAATMKDLASGSIIALHDGRQSYAKLRNIVARQFIEALGFRGAASPPSPPPAGAAETVRALPAIIDEARKRGFEFVSLEQFLHTS